MQGTKHDPFSEGEKENQDEMSENQAEEYEEFENSEEPENGQEPPLDLVDADELMAAMEGVADSGAAERIAALEEEIAKLKDALLRERAETENVRKRAQRDREDASKYAISNFARSLLPVADNLRRALDSVTEDQKKDPVLETFLAGVEATEREFLRACEQAGVERVMPGEEIFDPNLHEVMFEIDNTGKAAGTIIQVIEAGYVINGRLLRPARVAVAKGEAGEGANVDTKI